MSNCISVEMIISNKVCQPTVNKTVTGAQHDMEFFLFFGHRDKPNKNGF